MLVATRRAALLGLAIALLGAAPGWAQGVTPPWEPSEYDNEGPYIFTGSIGEPNVRVDVIEVGSTFQPDLSGDIFNDEYTGPQGQFRVDVGSCPVGFGCNGGGGDYQIVFHRLDQARTPSWAPGTYARVNGQKWSLAEVENGSREDRVLYTVTGGASLVPYTTISGTVRGTDGQPFDGAWVQAYDPAGLGYDAYAYPGFRVGEMYTTGGGKYTLRVPPGQWTLWFKERDYSVVKWYGCKPTRDDATYVDTSGGSVTGVDMDFSRPDCGGPPAPPPGPPPGPGPGPGGPVDGGGAPGGGGPTRLAIAGAPPARSPTGATTLSVRVPGPGTLTAIATGAAPKASAAKKPKKPKQLTIARGSVMAKRAGTVELVLEPTKAAKALLRRGRKLKARAKITFTPTSGRPSTVAKALTFRAVKRKRKAGGA